MRRNVVLAAVFAGVMGIMAGCVSCGEPQNETNENSQVSVMEAETGSESAVGAGASAETETSYAAPLLTQISDQSFPISLDGWGDVTFASFLPEDIPGGGDVQFKLLRDGQPVYEFPGKTQDNQRVGEVFVQVKAVSFKDYNDDGRTDVIALVEYRQLGNDGENYNDIYLYTQADGSDEFYQDGSPIAFLLKNYYNDSIGSVMDGLQAYKENFSNMELPIWDGTLRQLQVMADQVELWAGDDRFGAEYRYTVTDLDQNGRLELIVSTLQGSGLYTYSSYYEVNKALDGLELCEQTDRDERYSEADIQVDQVPAFYDARVGHYYYIFGDVVRNGAAEHYYNKRALWLRDGKIREWPLANMDVVQTTGETVIECRDAEGNAISEEEYRKIEDVAFSDFTKISADLAWFKPNSTADLKAMGSEALVEELTNSYRGFHLQRRVE